MFEKQKSFMEVTDLMYDGEVSNALTGFTPSMVFTPTTLASFEAELTNALLPSHSIPSNVLMSESSGNQFFARPITSSTSLDLFNEDDDDDDDDDDSSVDSNSNFTSVSTKNVSRAKAIVIKPSQKKEVCAVKPVEQKVRKLPGPRPSKPIEEMTPLEAERRRRRRERNKNAAAKCRQRRLEQTTDLTEETEKLERESERLEREIENLRRMKHQLEFVLESHKTVCTAVPAIAANDVVMDTMAAAVSNVCVVRPSNLPLPGVAGAGRGFATATSAGLDGYVFSFDTPTAFAGLTPLLSAADDLSNLNSPSAFMLFSP